MSISFDGDVAIVTGAGNGLGKAYALDLARRGARVVVNDFGGTVNGSEHDERPADQVVTEIRAAGGDAVASYASVATPEGGQAVVDTALESFGTVQVVVNNAGILRDRSFTNLTWEDVNQVLDVHLRGAFHVSQPAYRVMKENGYGRLLFASSSSGLLGNFGQANYGAAKAGVAGLSNALAIEGARYGITSNAIMPVAATRMTEGLLGTLADVLTPETVVPLVTYLVSRECTATHGIYSAIGGRFARVFIAVAPGWHAPYGPIDAEDVAAHWAQVEDRVGYTVPLSGGEEVEELVTALGITSDGGFYVAR